jgi:phospholipase C
MHMRRLVSTALMGLLVNPLAPLAAPRKADRDDPAPIRHIVVIFDENISFDHYFGTYPHALNPAEEPFFEADPGTPTANTLVGALLNNNPNLTNPANAPGQTNPFRLDRSQAVTADQDHDYGPEQLAFDHGLMDLFPVSVGTAGSPPSPPPSIVTTTGLVMGYYDGNTVTALWNYAQHFAMNDNSYGTNFGPSTVGALNLVSGQTNGVTASTGPVGCDSCAFVSDGSASGLTVIGDPDPMGDVCSTSSSTATMSGPNVGDLLSAHGITWGWFQGGFDLSAHNSNGTTGCNRSTTSALITAAQKDYVPHHEPFQYYATTRNLMHTRPSDVTKAGRNGDGANHQYDLNDFYATVAAGNMPAVSFLKPIKVQNGHGGNSDPLDEQAFLVHVINFLQTRPEWESTAVVIAYDDSDGWYDHQMSPIVNHSVTVQDHLTVNGACGLDGATSALAGPAVNHAQGRCGYGPRLPLLVISPLAKHNFVDHTVTDQTSILKFIEDTWLGGERLGNGSFDGVAHSIRNMFDFDQKDHDKTGRLVLSESTGEIVRK